VRAVEQAMKISGKKLKYLICRSVHAGIWNEEVVLIRRGWETQAEESNGA
jgi:hypothetical protein